MQGTGQNLNWFWKRWFFDSGYPVLAITQTGRSGDKFKVTVKSIGSKPVPVHLTITYKNGETQKLNRDISVWKGRNRLTLSFKPKGDVKKITLGNVHDADVDNSDNEWTAD